MPRTPIPPVPSLVSLIYVSTATRLFSDSALETLLARSRESNHAAGITGLLLHCEGNFMQALEGPAETVDAVFARIGRDSRHHGITRLSRQVITVREFDRWTMAFSPATAPEFLALSQACWDAEGRAAKPSGRGRRMLRDFWAACRRT